VAVLPWLEKQGVNGKLAQKYERTSWLQRVGHGAYMKVSDKVEWPGGLYALQEQLNLPVHAGAKTALQLLGYAHFLPLGQGMTVSIFSAPGTRLPAWFQKYSWGVKLRHVSTGLFGDDNSAGLTQHSLGGFSIRISSPERAIMEILHLVPRDESYDEARLLMEGLTTLRPSLVQTLLERCTSVKVKRLFMVLAEGSGHVWVNKLNPVQVDFGQGKRMLVKGGRLHPTYQITVPGPQP
jgi:hypothetical protein